MPASGVVNSTQEESREPMSFYVNLDAQGRAIGRLYEDGGEGFEYLNGDYFDGLIEVQSYHSHLTTTVLKAHGKRNLKGRQISLGLIKGDCDIQWTKINL